MAGAAHRLPALVQSAGLADRGCEFSCDEAVIRPLGEEGRRAYGDTLFRAVAAGGRDKGVPVSVALNESVELMKERLCAIMKFRKSSRLVTTVSVVLGGDGHGCLCGACGYTW